MRLNCKDIKETIALVLMVILVYGCESPKKPTSDSVEARLIGIWDNRQELCAYDSIAKAENNVRYLIERNLTLIYSIKNTTEDTLSIPIAKWMFDKRSHIEIRLKDNKHQTLPIRVLMWNSEEKANKLIPGDSVIFHAYILRLYENNQVNEHTYMNDIVPMLDVQYVFNPADAKIHPYHIPKIVFNNNLHDVDSSMTTINDLVWL